MSEGLFERFVVALEKIAANGGGVAPKTAAATAPAKPAPAANANPAAAGKAADKGAAKPAEKPAEKPKPADKPKAADKPATPPAGTTKAAGGKYNNEQVRDIIRKVANDPGLGKQSARDVLEEEGGVTTVSDLKPENYDKVYEACQVLLNGEGGKEAATDDFDPTA